MTGALSGLTVVELSSYVATPLCGMVLRQLGADVIRVEPIGGAPDRGRMPLAADGTSLYWSGLNGGKQDMAVDLGSAEGQKIVADLVTGGSGILLANSDRYRGLSLAGLSAWRPDIIHVLLTGTRDGGNAVGYTVQAASGFAEVAGPRDAVGPTNSAAPGWDIAAGLYLAVGLLAALHERRETGHGQQVRVALEDVALAAAGLLGHLAEAQLRGTERRRSGNEVYGTFGRDFVTADEVRFMVVVLTSGHWRRLLEATGLFDAMRGIEQALGADFTEETQRFQYRGVIEALLEPWFARRNWLEVQGALESSRALFGPYRSFHDLAAAALLRRYELFSEVDHLGAGRYLAPGSPPVMGDRLVGPEPAPRTGADTGEVLARLGIGEDERARLFAEGHVA
ncbi:CoA transferase [Nocardia sp. NPDC005366]|uniref:CoA transferase n=1 Tax=Nocardia sp. NPDC005366 TaxID=3156878 RepID=UPI0033B4411B